MERLPQGQEADRTWRRWPTVRVRHISSREQRSLTALKLVDLLRLQGIEIKRATEEFRVEGRVFPAGSYVVFCDQPKMGVIKNLLGRTFYPDSYWTRNPDGSPIMYDTATDTIGEFMGVDVCAHRQ
jgi:hypothetical protein